MGLLLTMPSGHASRREAGSSRTGALHGPEIIPPTSHPIGRQLPNKAGPAKAKEAKEPMAICSLYYARPFQRGSGVPSLTFQKQFERSGCLWLHVGSVTS